jgi:hypothetical protein
VGYTAAAAAAATTLAKPQRGEVCGVGLGYLRVRWLAGPLKGLQELVRPHAILLDDGYEPIVDPPESDPEGKWVVTEEERACRSLISTKT